MSTFPSSQLSVCNSVIFLIFRLMMDPYGGGCRSVARRHIHALATLVEQFYNVCTLGFCDDEQHEDKQKWDILVVGWPFKCVFFLHSFWCKSFNSATYPHFSLGCAACSPLRPDFGIFLLPFPASQVKQTLVQLLQGSKGNFQFCSLSNFIFTLPWAFCPWQRQNVKVKNLI